MKTGSVLLALALAGGLSTAAFAQGTIPGAEAGADRGAAAAGPVGAVVGGAVGAAAGTVGGVLGVPATGGCDSRTVHRENGEGDSETVHSTNCP